MNTTVGVFSTHQEAEDAINELRAFGVPESNLSYLYVDVDGRIRDDIGGKKVGSGAATGATTGAVIGAIAGLAVANGVLPGLGTFFVAGPLAAALGLTGAVATTAAGAATGLAAGGIIGALSKIGIDSTDAALYQSLVERGDVFVVAKTEDLVTKDVFIKGGAKEVREYTGV
ncbi:hypothetical protein A3G06_01745 [Candidatus Nomurabacteria bacterium RIFCSPLOWO2_12_FULL_46_14]|uniref:General stress protein 17M-like domain-containing protein n=1 Tax=Candidatus Nomurabacteria bacterium RIFCSPLOWO2_12_FULL_46_14 TaxID=1801797 RepID=A0A1F6YAY1_9BACT|nr:MAG: hypothetical protein A3G06_01745 [Candidatus Nomurabacteria bacterium RIFCSPLOWO2_12_FULL_46_14]